MRVPIPVLACAVAGPLLFVVSFLVRGALRDDGYSPLRHPVSALSYGPYGWVQQATFLVCGALILAAAVGLRWPLREAGWGLPVPVLLGLVGLGLAGAGLFLCDPIGGYPPGTPAVAVVRTWHGVAHDICSTPVFTALPAACLVAARRFARAGDHGLARISAAAGTATLALFVLTSIGFAQSAGLGPVAGLLQRLTIAVGFLWISVFALRLRRRSLAPA